MMKTGTVGKTTAAKGNMPKLKKGDVVRIPKGTATLMANPSLLDPEPIRGRVEYNAVGKVDTVRKGGIVTVAVWDAGRSEPWYCNVQAKALETGVKVLLTYDEKREILTWTDEAGMVWPLDKKAKAAIRKEFRQFEAKLKKARQ